MPTALLSVYNKTGIVEFARELAELGWNIISSGGTAKVLHEAGIPVKDVAELVGGGPILGHRVVTLSREVHAGLLASDDQLEELKALGIPRIDLVCVDLYPLQQEIARPGSTLESVIEKTDIGGPTMLRSAAKGRRIVICDPDDRMRVIGWLRSDTLDSEKRRLLAAKAEWIVAQYCLASTRYMSGGDYDGIIGRKVQDLRYGENAWQTPAMLYSTGTDDPLAIDKFRQLAGAPPSFVNITDIDRMLQTVTHIAAAFDFTWVPQAWRKTPKIAVAVKHGNPCGAAIGESPVEAIEKMVEGDTRAIFGGFVMTNFPIGVNEANLMLTLLMPEGKRRLLDGIVAPEFDQGAIEMMERKGDKCRFYENPALRWLNRNSLDKAWRYRYVRGGYGNQPNYTFVLVLQSPDIMKYGRATFEQEIDMLLAWAIGSTSNSNTITLVKNGMLIGNGVGQQDRVGGARLAVSRAHQASHDTHGAVACSDSFFPFPDGPQVLIEAGVKVILATSGSVNDKETIELCQRHGVALYLIPDSIGRGFFGH